MKLHCVSSIVRDRLSASDMMIIRKVIEYIYERYVLNEQQQQAQQQNPSMSPTGNGTSERETKMICIFFKKNNNI